MPTRELAQQVVVLDWPMVLPLFGKLIEKIRALDQPETDFGFLIIGRGALCLGGYLAKAFPHRPLLVLIARKYHGEALAREDGKVVIESAPREADVRGRQWIVVDEVWDYGDTLQEASQWVVAAGGTILKTAVLHYKTYPTPQREKPDLFAVAVRAPTYFVYPWEPDQFA